MPLHKTFDPTTDLNDLSGRVVIVTGANTGIGFSTVKFLAHKGAKVYLGARSAERGRLAAEKLQVDGIAPGKVVWFRCDLGSPVAAKKSGEDFLQLESRLNILVNNAGWTGTPYGIPDNTAEDGITEASMTNHFGTFQFTKTLLPLLIKTSEEPNSYVRIITLSSYSIRQRELAASSDAISFKTLDIFKKTYEENFTPWLWRCIVSKLANAIFSNALQRKLESTSIICISIHPGVVDTSFHTRFRFQRVMGFLVWIFTKSQDEGAYNSCMAAASPIVRESGDKYIGAFLLPVGQISSAGNITHDHGVQGDLWETTEKYLKASLPV